MGVNCLCMLAQAWLGVKSPPKTVVPLEARGNVRNAMSGLWSIEQPWQTHLFFSETKRLRQIPPCPWPLGSGAKETKDNEWGRSAHTRTKSIWGLSHAPKWVGLWFQFGF